MSFPRGLHAKPKPTQSNNTMPIDVLTERTYPISELARKLPKRRARSTIWKWCTKGVKISRYSEERFKLESVVIGGVLHSSLEAYKRWAEKLTYEFRKYH